MVQLSKDHFDVGNGFLKVGEAVRELLKRVTNVAAIEEISLKDAGGRILAEDIISPMPVPSVDNSAVDGYAVYHADLNIGKETILPLAGRVAAGENLPGKMQRGTAVRIFTGAPIPAGDDGRPDTIMMQEDCRLMPSGAAVKIMPGISKAANYRHAGEDIEIGQLVLKRGIRLAPQDVGVAASIGTGQVKVYHKLRLAILSSGNEISEPGGSVVAGGLYDSNRYMLISALRGMGYEVIDLGILPDDRTRIQDALAAAATRYDAIITTGGMSVGEEDHMKAAIAALGQINFWRLAIKPGRPVGFGFVGEASHKTPLIGLPGNPVAAMTTLLVIGRPLLMTLSGQNYFPPHYFPVVCGFAHRKKSGPREYIRARLEMNSTGRLVARRHGKAGAAMLTSMVGADGFVELPEEVTELNEGDIIDFLPFSEVL